MSYQNWSEEFQPLKITLKQDEFVCKKIDKKDYCEIVSFLSLKMLQDHANEDKYKKINHIIQSMETLEKKEG